MSQKPKIKVLFRHRSMEMGGVEKVLLSMLNNLDREKFDLSLALNLFQGELRNEIPKHVDFKILAKGKEDFPQNKISHKIALVLRALKLLYYRKFPFFADRFVRKNHADVEIATGYTMFSDVLNSSNKNSKKIGWFHSDITAKNLEPIAARLIDQIPRFDYFIFGSQQSKDILIKTYPTLKLPENQVILNAIDGEDLKKKAAEYLPDLPAHQKIFVAVGRLDARKGHRKLLEAHVELIHNGFPHIILLIGDGQERQNLQNLALQLGVSSSFKLLGTMRNPYPFVKNADFFIMPSESEGWPLIIAEALILQKPIVATAVGGIPEMISHKKNGYLVDYDVNQMAEAMREFIENTALLEQIQENLKDSEAQFDSRKIFENVENIIVNLARK